VIFRLNRGPRSFLREVRAGQADGGYLSCSFLGVALNPWPHGRRISTLRIGFCPGGINSSLFEPGDDLMMLQGIGQVRVGLTSPGIHD